MTKQNQNSEQWRKQLREWAEAHPATDHPVSTDRDDIYGLRGLVLLPENRIQLSEEGQKQFAKLILNPPPINEAMKEAMAEHDRLIISDDDTPID